MEQTSHHRDTEAQRTEKKGTFLCASVVDTIDFFIAFLGCLPYQIQGIGPVARREGS
jgi:hypothetical protein